MGITLNYLFDPLCGWCYGASPVVSRLRAEPGLTLHLMPAGLFSGQGARKMDADFAAYAWENDLRIGAMTGQPFTPAYRENVLSNRQQPFDSGPATLALTAVWLMNAARELEVLSALQHARYVEGLDVTSLPVLAALLERMGLRQEAGRLLLSDAELLRVNQQRVGQAQLLMHESGVRGVPAFIAESSGERWVVSTAGMYADTDKWISQILA